MDSYRSTRASSSLEAVSHGKSPQWLLTLVDKKSNLGALCPGQVVVYLLRNFRLVFWNQRLTQYLIERLRYPSVLFEATEKGLKSNGLILLYFELRISLSIPHENRPPRRTLMIRQFLQIATVAAQTVGLSLEL